MSVLLCQRERPNQNILKGLPHPEAFNRVSNVWNVNHSQTSFLASRVLTL